MKQRRKVILALLLSASVAATPIASVPVLAEELDFAAVEDVEVAPEDEESEEAEEPAVVEDSDLDEDYETTDDSVSVEDSAEDLFSAGEVGAQDNATEAKTHSIKVNVINSKGEVAGMYAMENAVVTKQDDGTYLVRMHQKSINRNYMALTDDVTQATNHEVDWYVGGGDDGYWFTIPVANLTDTVYASFSYTKNVNAGKKWDNVQTITFDTTSMADTTEKDAVASDINKLPATVTESELAPTNTTGMFNVVKAILKKGEKRTFLDITLSGKGYHYLYKGTYEEAVANGDNRNNWIAGKEVNGQWHFTIPVSDGETYLPIVAISNSYLTKYEQGKNSLERAFYPRQIELDENAKSLVAGDYDHTNTLTVSNSVKMFKITDASLETIGGPNSNNYQEILHLTMGSDSFDKVFIGSMDEAAKAESTTDIKDKKADLVVKANAMGGTSTVDYLDKEVVFSFHSVKNNAWYERYFNISKTNGTLTVTPVPEADYTAVDAALATVPEKLSIYTDETAAAVTAAVNAVKKGCSTTQQAAVDKMAADINAAVAALVLKVPATGITLDATTQKLDTGKTFTLKATVAPANTADKVVWSSSNAAVAKVSEDGVVTAVKPGTAVITATAGSVKATCTVTVANPVVKATGVKITAPTRRIAAGKKVQLKATVAPSNTTNKAVKWTTSNKKVATVNSKGLVTFRKKAGGKKVTITATSADGSKKYAKITLTCMKGSVKSIKLSGKTTLKPGKTTKLKAKVTTVNGKANKSVVWSSSNTKLATVDKNGKVKAVKGKKGTVKITARAVDGSRKKATIKIRIK